MIKYFLSIFISFFCLFQSIAYSEENGKNASNKAASEIEALYFKVNCEPKKILYENCPIANFALQNFIHRLKSQSIVEYNTQFGHINLDIEYYNKNQNYVEKLNNNNPQDLLKLYVIYKNPMYINFSLLPTKANQILLKAISLGSQEAIRELGYDRPYARKTQVDYGKISANIISNCEPYSKLDSKYYCTLFRLTIKNEYSKYHWTIVNYNDKNEFEPFELSIIELASKIFIKLVSKNSDLTTQREDYFSIDGNYLGSSSKIFSANYIFEFRNSNNIFNDLIINDFRNHKTVVAKVILKYPSYNMFKIQEKKRKIFNESIVNPSFTAVEGFPTAQDFGLNTIEYLKSGELNNNSKIEDEIYSKTEKNKLNYYGSVVEYAFRKGHLPSEMPNIITYINFDYYLERALKGDLLSIKYIYDIVDNQLSFIHKEQYRNKLNIFLNSLSAFKKLRDIVINKKLNELLYNSRNNTQANDQNGFYLKKMKHPYITLNRSKYKNLDIEVFVYCDNYTELRLFGSNFGSNFNPPNCYAAKMTVSKNGIKNIYFFIEEDIIDIQSKLKNRWHGLNFDIPSIKLLKSLNSNDFDYLTVLILDSYTEMSNDLIDLNGLYLDSGVNSIFGFRLRSIIGYKGKKFYYKDFIGLPLSVFPNWEDVELELEEDHE
jgi:hypothetical protein